METPRARSLELQVLARGRETGRGGLVGSGRVEMEGKESRSTNEGVPAGPGG